MIAITFAVPQESCEFVAARKRRRDATAEEVLVVHTGIGLAAAERAVLALIARHAPAAIVSAGFAGALDGKLRVGDAMVATNRSATAFVERCRARWKDDARVHFDEVVTSEWAAESPDAKAQLARESGASAVDMETSAIEAVCRGAGVPLLALRVISDTANTPLPIPFSVCYDLARQGPRPFAAARHLALHPGALWPLARFIRDLAVARHELARRLEEILNDLGAAASISGQR